MVGGRIFILMSLSLLILSGCATMALPPPPPVISENKGRLLITRSADDMLYATTAARLFVNGKEAGALMRGQTVPIEVAPGEVELSTDAPLTMGSYALKIPVEAGLEVRLQLATRGGHFVGAMTGLAGMLVDAAINDNKGPFTLTILSKNYEPHGNSLEARLVSLNSFYASGKYTEAEYVVRRKAILEYAY